MRWETQGMPTALPKTYLYLPPAPQGHSYCLMVTSCTHGGWALGLAQLSLHWYHFSLFSLMPAHPHPLRQDCQHHSLTGLSQGSYLLEVTASPLQTLGVWLWVCSDHGGLRLACTVISITRRGKV